MIFFYIDWFDLDFRASVKNGYKENPSHARVPMCVSHLGHVEDEASPVTSSVMWLHHGKRLNDASFNQSVNGHQHPPIPHQAPEIIRVFNPNKRRTCFSIRQLEYTINPTTALSSICFGGFESKEQRSDAWKVAMSFFYATEITGMLISVLLPFTLTMSDKYGLFSCSSDECFMIVGLNLTPSWITIMVPTWPGFQKRNKKMYVCSGSWTFFCRRGRGGGYFWTWNASLFVCNPWRLI